MGSHSRGGGGVGGVWRWVGGEVDIRFLPEGDPTLQTQQGAAKQTKVKGRLEFKLQSRGS